MAEYFIVSWRLNGNNPENLGLVSSEEQDVYIRSSDNTKWKRRPFVIDYRGDDGFSEGYYRIPLPGFDKLVDIVLHSDDSEDRHGAASAILRYHADELLDKCFEIFASGEDLDEYCDFFSNLSLEHREGVNPNRSPVQGKHYPQIEEEHRRWEMVEQKVGEVLAARRATQKRSLFERLFVRPPKTDRIRKTGHNG